MAVMPALLLAEMLSLFSVLWGPKCQILPTVPQSAVHPAQWCWYRTLWDLQGDARRPSCTHMAVTGMLGFPEKQQSKPQALLASLVQAFCLGLISSWF